MTGVVTLSIEVELGWGTHDIKRYNHLSSDGSAERRTLAHFLDLCEEYHIPVSFNVVGHLLHDSCSGCHDGPYPPDWWREDPGTASDTDPLFYAPDLVDTIAAASPQHEICTHTYSHILCDEVSDNLLDHELRTATRLHTTRGLPEPRSLVPPRHQTPSPAILQDNNIIAIREALTDYIPDWRYRLGKVGSFWWMLFRDHPVTELRLVDGVVRSNCALSPSLTTRMLPNGQSSPHPTFRVLPRQLRQRLHTRYLRSAIDQAAAQDGHINLWTHVHNMAHEAQWKPIRHGLAYLADRRDSGDVRIERMRDLPAIVNQRE